MNPIFALVFLFAVASAATNEQPKTGGEPAKLNDAIIAKYGEQPCLNKVIGQRLTHPTDPHKFLRCMSLEALWIETCPDGLFYNPSMELCDWSSKPRPTTRTNEVVRNRPVLFKTKVNDGSISSEVVESTVGKERERPVSAVEDVSPVAPTRDEPSAVTPSLLDELRKKLNLDTTERPSREMDEEKPSTKRPTLRLIEVTTTEKPEERAIDEEVVSTKTKKPTLRLVEVPPVSADEQSSDFVVQSTSRRMFLKSAERKNVE